MVVGVCCFVIPFTRDLEVCGDCLLLDCEGEEIVVFVLIEILISTVPLHLFKVPNDLVQVTPGDPI